jgi:Xaa-Pro aminopeptidase
MPFVPLDVFSDRAERVRAYLDEQGLEALIANTAGNVFMLSGWHLDVEPWERPVAIVIPKRGEPFMVLNELSTNHLKMATERGSLAIRDYSLYTEHPRTRNRTYTRDQWAQLLSIRLQERGISKGKIGVEGAGPTDLLRANPALSFVNVTPFLIEMRQVKYPAELEIMRECAALTDYGQDRYMELVKPGENVSAFDARIGALIYEEAARRFPEDRFEARGFSLSGPASAAPHGTGANVGATFEKGHGIVNIIVCRLSGLVVESERTLFLGEPSDIQKRAFTASSQATEAASAQMVAGNPVSSADEAAQAVIEAAGFGENINHRTGHGVGIIGHEYPEDMPFLHRPFYEREVYSAEPGIYIYGVGGFRQDDTVIVGAKTPEVLNKRSKQLEDQIVPV